MGNKITSIPFRGTPEQEAESARLALEKMHETSKKRAALCP